MSTQKEESLNPVGVGKRRLRMHELLSPDDEPDWVSRAMDLFLVALILADLLLILLHDAGKLSAADVWLFGGVNLILGLFVVEYALRLWSVGADPAYAGARGLLRFMMRPLMLLDLFSILPAVGWLPFIQFDLLEPLLLLRIFRLLRLIRYFKPVIVVLGRTIMRVQRELGVLFVGMFVVVLTASGLIHRLEPETFSSTGEAMWWSIATLTTVGYGDLVPVTLWGRIIASGLMLVGMAMFALPAGLLGAAFTREITLHQERRQINRERRRERRRGEELKRKEKAEAESDLSDSPHCPHCGKDLAPYNTH